VSSGRSKPGLRPPPAGGAGLDAFPRFVLEPERPLVQVVKEGREPWWFGSSLAGRFDLPAPFGTCYLAEDPLAALLEVIGPDPGLIPLELLTQRRLRTLHVPRHMVLADATDRRARDFGVTGEIGSIVPYELPQAWAASLRAAGFGGIVYWLRHDPARARGVALFGPQGARRSWRRGRARPIDDSLLRRLAAETGLEIARIPAAAELDLAS